MPSNTSTIEKQGGSVVGAEPSGAGLPPPIAPQFVLPPGVAPQINLNESGAPPEPFLAPTPRRDVTILGYGYARVGRVPPYGGSPSTSPLTGIPLMRALPPAPPEFRKQALEPGHQERDPFRKLAAIEVGRRDADAPDKRLDRLDRSAAALRAPGPRRGSAGRHDPIAGAAGPSGTGGASVAASLGVPAADSVRGSDRGVYVSGRASGARWEADASVAPGSARGSDPCAPGAGPRGRPLSPLQSVRRYAQQQAAFRKVPDAAGPETSRPPSAQRSDIAGGKGTSAASKGTSAAFKGLSKAQGPARAFRGLAGRQEDGEGAKPDPEGERRLLALRTQVTGLAGRFGANRRCRMDIVEALRPAEGPVEWRREHELTRKDLGSRAAEAPRSAPHKVPGTGGSAPAPFPPDSCAVPQKYAARAGVTMRDSPAKSAREAAPPGSGGPAQADEGIQTGRQGPTGQQAYPPQDGADARSRDEAAPGRTAFGGMVIGGAGAAAQGMGGPSTPVLLEIDRAFRREANARIDAQKAAEKLHTAINDYGKSLRNAEESSRIFKQNAQYADDLKRAAREMSEQGGRAYTGALAGAVNHALAFVDEIEAQGTEAKQNTFDALLHLSAVNEVAKEVAGKVDEVRTEQRRIRARARVLGNMDTATLRRRALEAEHRAERDGSRRERRALRRERGGVFKARQFAEVARASERAFDLESRSVRYQAQAERTRAGSARDRAQATADYYGSLAEAERHRASVARSHVMGEEIAKARGMRGFLRDERARTDEFYRNERKLAELERFRGTYEPQLETVDRQLDDLIDKDPDGNPKHEHGSYVAKNKKDAQKVRDLQRKQERLERKLKGKLGDPPVKGKPGRSWPKINGLNRSQNALAAKATSGPFAGTKAGLLVAALHREDLPISLRSHMEAMVRSAMTEVIADASARSKAAFQAGLDAGLAQYDPKLTQEQREAAAGNYADAVAEAAQDVAKIEGAIAENREDGTYFETGWDQYDRDQQELEEAKRRLAALLDVCNNHPACGDKKRDCEAQSNAEQTCKLGPPSSGGAGTDTSGGVGTSISSVDPSAPGGDAKAPDGSKEADGKDEPDDDKKVDERRDNKEEPVEPSEAQPGERRTVADDTKDDDKKKKEVPTPSPGGGTTPFRDYYIGGAGLVMPFANASLSVGLAPPPPPPPPDAEEETKKAEEEDPKGEDLDAYLDRELARIEAPRILALKKLAVAVAMAATREQAIEAIRQAREEVKRTLRVQRARIDELLQRVLNKDLPPGIKFGSEKYRLLMQARALGAKDPLWTPRRRSTKLDADDRELDRLILWNGVWESRLASLDYDEWTLSRSTDFEATSIRLEIGRRLRDEQDALLALDPRQIRGALQGKGRAAIKAAITELDQRIRWANIYAENASLTATAFQQEETDRNSPFGAERKALAKRNISPYAISDPLVFGALLLFKGEDPRYVDWAEAAARHFTELKPPDFGNASPDAIDRDLDAAEFTLKGYRENLRAEGLEIEKLAGRVRTATVLFAAAAVTAVFAVSIAAIGAGATLTASWTGAGLGGAQSLLRQGAQLIDDPNRAFSGREVLQGVVTGAVLGPVLEAVPASGIVLGEIAVGSAAHELVEGHYATATLDAFSAAVPLGMAAARVRGGSPLQPGDPTAVRPGWVPGEVSPPALPRFFYKGGPRTKTNLNPRSGQDAEGLSVFQRPELVWERPEGYTKAVQLEAKRVQETGLDAALREPPEGHWVLFPKDGSLDAWAASRLGPKEEGPLHWYTQALMDIGVEIKRPPQ